MSPPILESPSVKTLQSIPHQILDNSVAVIGTPVWDKFSTLAGLHPIDDC
jgi:hypothetical protein